MGASLAATLALPAWAQSWPAKPVTIVVPFGPGGPADVYARILGQALTEALGQQFIVDDKPGAGAIIGTSVVAKAQPDGYTLLMMSNTHTTNETLFTHKPYQLMRDLVPVTPVNSSDLVMVVHPSVPAKTLQEFIALAKAKPGQLSYASSGPGTPYHMAGELFKAMSGTDILHVPHKSSGEARNDVMGGHVQMMLDAVTTMKGPIEANEVRALATTGLKRSAILPNVPTVDESGVPGYEATIWLGIMAPKGTPTEIVDKVNAEVAKIVASPKIKEAWAQQGAVPITMTPAAFGEFLEKDIAKWARIVKISGATIQ
jgi:tripartite-type tricarboxylate transporter receptor subunit TctC